MPPDPKKVALLVTQETGLPFDGRGGFKSLDNPFIEVTPAGHPSSQTFSITAITRWRSVEVRFEPGAFSGQLVTEMGKAERARHGAFRAVLEACIEDGATVDLKINDQTSRVEDLGSPMFPWYSAMIEVRRGQLPIGLGSAAEDEKLISRWISRTAAAVICLLPLEELGDDLMDVPTGFPEGGLTRVQVNRYERDRRNRAAALAIHGLRCQGCETELTSIYGDAAAGFIEVHHITPVSKLGPGYSVDPKCDLVPLCPNCHGVIHRREPPIGVEELRQLIASNSSGASRSK